MSFSGVGRAMPPEPADAPGAVVDRAHHSARLGFNSARRSRGSMTYALVFDDADIRLAAEEVLATTLRLSFTIDPDVSGKVSLHVDRPMTRDQLLEAFEAALALNDVVIVRVPGGFVLMRRTKAKSVAPLRHIASSHVDVEPGYQLLSVPIAYASPSDLAKSLETATPGIVVRADDQQGVVVLAGASPELRNALQAIRLFDRNNYGSGRTRTVVLHSASAAALAADLASVLHASGVSGVNIVPIGRLNEIVLTAPSETALAEASEWIERLDTQSREEASALWVYHPLNAPATGLAESLNQVFSGGGSSGGQGASGPSEPISIGGTVQHAPLSNAPETASDAGLPSTNASVRVSVDKDTNTLLIMAPQSRWLSIKAVLDQLDVPAAQVLIEATVLEVTLGKQFQSGVDWSVLGAGGRLTVTSTQNNTGAVAPQFPGISLNYLGNSVQAAVDLLASQTNVEIVSAPKLVALDNQSATLQVGDQIPVVTQSSQSTAAPGAPIVVNTEYRDTGVILKIKPHVNGPNSVLLEVSQEVSSVAPTSSSSANESPTIQQRKFDSQLTLSEGETVAVGGLISTNHSLTNQGIPWFKDIPGIGTLFKGENKNDTRTEIIVLLTAHIIRSREDAEGSLRTLRPQLPTLESHGLLPAK